MPSGDAHENRGLAGLAAGGVTLVPVARVGGPADRSSESHHLGRPTRLQRQFTGNCAAVSWGQFLSSP